MKIVKALVLDKYNDSRKYSPVDGIIFENLMEDTYCLTLYCELEEGEDTQYPLEDILDEHYANCTDYMEEREVDGKKVFIVEIEGSLDKESSLKNIKEISGLIGKRVLD